jgi:Protein kinase domain
MSTLPASGLLANGSEVSGRYIVQASLGRGGMAAVYRAFDPKLNLEVALKVLPPHLAVQPTFLSRFRREGQTLAKLNHPHILRLYEIGEDPSCGLYYLVLELLGGGTLKQRLRGRPWSVGETVDLLRPVVTALDYAHSQKPPVVHRDLKPANIMFDSRGRVVVSDFGLARLLAPEQPNPKGDLASMSLTVGQVVGTPAYMAPEQAEGRRVGPAADLYAVGIIAYELLTGNVPFQADTPLATLLQVVSRPLPLPTALNRALSPATERVLLKALGRDPAHRFASGAELVAALAATDHSSVTMAAGPVLVPRGRRVWPLAQAPRQARLAAIPLVWAALLVAGGGGYALLTRQPAPAAQQESLAAVPLPALAAVPTATSQPSVVPTVAPTSTPRPSPTASPTPTAAQVWAQTSRDLDVVWGKDWPRTVALLTAFRDRFPDDQPSAEKLYAALVDSGQALLDDGQTPEGIAQLERAQALAPEREEAMAALAALTPTPEPTPTPAPVPVAPAAPVQPRAVPQPPAPAPRQPAPVRPAAPAAPAPVAPAPQAPTPTKTGLHL